MQVVWLKRDLRIQDNRALSRASERGETLPLYIVEPDLWTQPDMSGRQWAFVAETLEEFRTELGELGQPLVVRIGDAIEILEHINAEFGISTLWSHEETGNFWTFQRDQRVARWCRATGIEWHELQNHGVKRRLRARDGWAKSWDSFMAEPIENVRPLKPLRVVHGDIPNAMQLGLPDDVCEGRQVGGRRAAKERLDSFLDRRGETYRTAMSSPLNGAHACSRLSPHLAWGSLSMREVAQATWSRQSEVSTTYKGRRTKWRGALKSFSGRLHWHCHFIQKLEDEPRLEFENLHKGYDGVRPSLPDTDRVQVWSRGETGLPFLDACMRSLRATGWLNFRMRAMVMASASYHLWLHWRAPGLELARLFTDYEPGIHWSQVQMQSGTTGINTVRIYNPVKQGYDQDPSGEFTRRWVPELAAIPDHCLQEPWKAENAHHVIGKTYPRAIVDHLQAAKEARTRIWAVRGGASFRSEAKDIQKKHGSRKSGLSHRGRSGRSPKAATQLSLPLDM